MNYEIILAIDPSGNFEEGKGTTGICLFDAVHMQVLSVCNISAREYKTKEEYWQKHIDLINDVNNKFENVLVVIEDFTLDPRRALQQSHSKMETPKLIGIIQLHCTKNNIQYKMQRAVEVKNRWADHILEYKQYITKRNRMYYIKNSSMPISRHCKDAIRHAVHYSTFYNKEDNNGIRTK